MATVTSAQAASTFPVYKPTGGLAFAYGVYEIASALSKDDIVEFCLLPPCRVTDGFLRSDDIDTGTEALEIDVGVSGDTDQFLNSGVITGDAVANHLPAHTAATVMLHFNGLGSGPVSLTSETTTVIGTVVAAANSGGTGTLYCGVYYLEP